LKCHIELISSKMYFFLSQNLLYSLSLEYHMESIFGSNASLTNIPQVRYLQAPAAFKVLHLKKFLSSKYDLNNLKKPMSIDIIYEGNILSEELSLMDIAYSYNWERVCTLYFFLFLLLFILL
jgi:RAWUL domain RING finger- and  WD40-associated ubiquitin-like